jgi:hypothetical protein
MFVGGVGDGVRHTFVAKKVLTKCGGEKRKTKNLIAIGAKSGDASFRPIRPWQIEKTVTKKT